MKIILLIAAFIILGLGIGSYIGFDISFEKAIKKTEPKVAVKEVNIQASFAIFTNGTLREFTDSKYHNRSVDVFITRRLKAPLITSENPNIVYVKKKGVTWNDFFKTLPSPMKLTPECLTTGIGQQFCTDENSSLKFFLNGKREDNLLSKEIRHKDQALITYGNETDKEVEDQMSKIPVVK